MCRHEDAEAHRSGREERPRKVHVGKREAFSGRGHREFLPGSRIRARAVDTIRARRPITTQFYDPQLLVAANQDKTRQTEAD